MSSGRPSGYALGGSSSIHDTVIFDKGSGCKQSRSKLCSAGVNVPPFHIYIVTIMVLYSDICFNIQLYLDTYSFYLSMNLKY